MFLVSMFRLAGWKGVAVAIVLGIVARVIIANILFHKMSTVMMNTHPTPGQRALFAALLNGSARPGRPLPDNPQQAAAPAPGAPSSSWLIFASDDPASGDRVYHARLSADRAERGPVSAAPPGIIQLQQTAHRDGMARLTLAGLAPAGYAGIATMQVQFDSAPPRSVAGRGEVQGAVCAVTLADFAGFRDALLNAQTLSVQPQLTAGTPQAVLWHVSGPSWDVN